MKPYRYMVVDVSNVVKGATFHGVDKENGRKVPNEEGKDVQVNSAEYGFDTAVEFLAEKLRRFDMAPKDMIFVVEGPNSKLLRTSISDTYKANRKGKLPQEAYDEVKKAQEMLLKQFLRLGARTVTQPGLEADDIIAYLAKRLPSCVIISTDGDMQQLVDAKAHLFYDGKVDTQRYLAGIFPHRYTTLFKALVGDPSDNIKGARGFGEQAFLQFYTMWGDEGCDEMLRMIEQRCLEELTENVGDLKALGRIVEDRENVYIQYDLARMYPEKVNTWRRPLDWQAGYVEEFDGASDHPTLGRYFARRKIVHRHNLDATLDWFRVNIKEADYIALDIETSSSEESDEWQAAKVKKDEEAEDIGVDMFGHELTSLALTFGDNDQYSLYFPVDHAEKLTGPKNVTREALVKFVTAIPQTTPIIVHNSYFELTVLEREIGDLMRDNGWHGFLPNVFCTRLLGTYVDENDQQGLKHLSLKHLGHQQVTYEEVTRLEIRHEHEVEFDGDFVVQEEIEVRHRKMRELTVDEAFDYGTDDTRCTTGIFNHFRNLLEIEGTWDVYLKVEQDASYLTALAFNSGTPISMERLLELEREDKVGYDAGWAKVRDFLISKGWAGTVCPQARTAEDVTASFIKDCYAIVAGVPRESEERKDAGIEDEFLANRTRTPAKLVTILESIGGQELLAQALRQALDGEVQVLNGLLAARFDGEPKFNVDSPKQNTKLLFELMGLPVRLRNKPTDKMRAAGIYEGTPRTDDLAVQWAVQNDVEPGTAVYEALKAFQAMKVANTRRKMFYEPYRRFQHWKDNLIHGNLTQNGAGTRRYTSSGPNLQQLPKHPKATGEPARFREVYVPHHSKAVIVSLDFSGQELRLIADYSQDPNMLACYVGNDLKDMHALTAAGILKKKALAGRMEQLWTMAGNTSAPAEQEDAIAFTLLVERWKSIDYTGFTALDTTWPRLYKTLRALGKKTNFTTEYGAQAPKLAETLLVDEDEAQQYIDAKSAAFTRAEAWKQEVIEEFKKTGGATTMMGAVRHLSEALRSGNKWEIGKAERQAVNFKIQSSASEMTKLAMGRVWRAGLCYRYDARFIAPIHDELVFSVAIADLVPFLRELHALMIEKYATMQVPIVSSISIGKNFGQQIELGETVSEEAVNDALYEIFPDMAPMKIAA